jgi:Protein of unknown function (DUF3108)
MSRARHASVVLALTIALPAHAAPIDRAVAPSPFEAAAVDASPMPDGDAPPVVPIATPGGKLVRPGAGSVGWTAASLQPPLRDPRRRMPATARPKDFGPTLAVGERFRFDVTFGGNNAGLAEAEIVALEADPRGGPPQGAPILRIEGHARTSGIVSLLATVTDDMTSLVDARSGATIWSTNVLVYSGWSPVGYKKRVTTSSYEGRGQVRIVDTKDGKARKQLKHAPLDTFDPLAVMAWVRAQTLRPGERVKAHVIDGTTLMRVEVETHPAGPMEKMPSIGKALGLGKNDAVRITGTMTRVDAYDQPLPGKRVFSMRAWLSADARKIPLAMESDMWVGALRLELSSYDPPQQDGAATDTARGQPNRQADRQPDE